MWSSRRQSATYDEPGHLAAGLAIWRDGRFDAYAVNPPLPRLIASLPVAIAAPDAVVHVPAGRLGVRIEGAAGRSLFNKNRDALALLFLARLTTIAWAVLGAWLAHRWARELWGRGPALGVLILWCTEPLLGGHAQLVTPDVPAATAGLAAAYACHRLLERPTVLRAATCAVALGIALLAKFTLLALVPAFAIAIGAARQMRRRFALGAMVLAGALVVVNAGYGCRGTGTPSGELPLTSRAGIALGAALAPVPSPVPADYLLGLDAQRRDFETGAPSYLRGEWRWGGWWHYYLYALAVKLPPAHLALVVAGLVAGIAGLRRSRRALVLVAPCVLVIVLVSSQTGFNHHARYVLPAMPFALVLAGGPIAWLARSRRRAIAAAVAAVVSTASVAAAYPHWLSYFSPLAGGPTRGADHLLDSNVDWGQDLLALRDWLAEHRRGRPLALAYFGPVDPAVLGIAYAPPPLFAPLRPGLYAISVNFVRGMAGRSFTGTGGIYRVPPAGLSYATALRPIARAGYSILIFEVHFERTIRGPDP